MIDKFKQFLETIYRITEATNGKYTILSGGEKEFKGSGRKKGKRNLNVFNMYSSLNSICSTSIPLDAKEPEIPTFRKLLSKYDLRKTVVTADALHCQRETCEVVISKKGVYVFKAKDNKKTLTEEIKKSFKEARKKIQKLNLIVVNTRYF